jgi:hypothetical protein
MFVGHAMENVDQVAIDGDGPIHMASVGGNLKDVIAFIEGITRRQCGVRSRLYAPTRCCFMRISGAG